MSVVSTLLLTVMSSCGDDSAGDAGRFCGEVEANSEALFTPEIESASDIGPLLDLYRRIGAFAPLAIEADWDQLILNYETANTVVVDDEESVQAATAQAYQSEKSAAAVKVWLQENCAVDIGPVATIVAQNG
ncbi:hypothetical protein [Ilumatobacter nonamiensis]|uniref:hypothetical protein n=1 Tax=Ilumatobacter nonamiensis TaxID=467093 RepID=UPI0011D1DD34|nr:hypothetical protein [Ilumatobacter nonamiensis]